MVSAISCSAECIASPDIVSSGFTALPDVIESKGRIGLRDRNAQRRLYGVSREVAAIASNIRELRKARKWTQTKLAEEMGVTQARISDWERQRYPSMDLTSVLSLAKGFGVTVDQIIAGFDAEYDALVRKLSAPAPLTVNPTSVPLPDTPMASQSASTERGGAHGGGTEVSIRHQRDYWRDAYTKLRDQIEETAGYFVNIMGTKISEAPLEESQGGRADRKHDKRVPRKKGVNP